MRGIEHWKREVDKVEENLDVNERGRRSCVVAGIGGLCSSKKENKKRKRRQTLSLRKWINNQRMRKRKSKL